MGEEMSKPLVIVDITAILFRKYFSGMSHITPEGLEIGGVWGVCTTLRDIIKSLKPKYLACVFDAGQRTFRNDIYDQYKANRGSPPEDLIPQFDLSYRLCVALGIPSFRMPGYEADDLMATLATISVSQDIPVQMVTIDKDLNQMIQDRPISISRINFHKNQVFTSDSVISSMGVLPDQCNDLMALIGDSVDNIPGVRGFGPKRSSELIRRFGSLAEIFENLEALKKEKRWSRLAHILEQEKEKAELSKRLVILKRDIKLHPEVIDIKEQFKWGNLESYAFLKTLGLQRYHSVLKPL